MAAHYQAQVNTIEDEVEELSRSEPVYPHMSEKGRYWPYILSIADIIVGTVITFLGISEVFIVPMLESKDDNDTIWFDKRTCYGCGLYAGLLLVITGSHLARVILTGRNSTIHRFYSLNVLSVLGYLVLLIILLVAYTNEWTTYDKYPAGCSVPDIHLAMTIFCLLGLALVFTSFAMYFDVVCCLSFDVYAPWRRCLFRFFPFFQTTDTMSEEVQRLFVEESNDKTISR